MSIGGNLRTLRLSRGLTQEQAAEKLGVARQTLSSYESERTRPDIAMLARLCELYGTDLDGVVYGEERALKATRCVRSLALALLALLISLTLLSSAFLWSANRFFPLSQGYVDGVETPVLQSHLRLTEAWRMTDGAILTLALLGFFALLVLSLSGGAVMPLKRRLLYMAALAGGVVLAAIPFALTDSVFTPTDYLLTPSFVIWRMLLFFAAELAIELVRKTRKKPRGAA